MKENSSDCVHYLEETNKRVEAETHSRVKVARLWVGLYWRALCRSETLVPF